MCAVSSFRMKCKLVGIFQDEGLGEEQEEEQGGYCGDAALSRQ